MAPLRGDYKGRPKKKPRTRRGFNRIMLSGFAQCFVGTIAQSDLRCSARVPIKDALPAVIDVAGSTARAGYITRGANLHRRLLITEVVPVRDVTFNRTAHFLEEYRRSLIGSQ